MVKPIIAIRCFSIVEAEDCLLEYFKTHGIHWPGEKEEVKSLWNSNLRREGNGFYLYIGYFSIFSERKENTLLYSDFREYQELLRTTRIMHFSRTYESPREFINKNGN